MVVLVTSTPELVIWVVRRSIGMRCIQFLCQCVILDICVMMLEQISKIISQMQSEKV